MRVLVFGASGATGLLLLEEATSLGHAVTAFVRDPAKLASHNTVEVLKGDVADPAAVRQAVAGQGAVLCALGAATPLRRDPTLVAGVGHITAAMHAAGVPRLVYLSFLGVPAGRHQLSAVGRYVVAPLVMRNVVADHVAKEQIIERSQLDWTIVRPPRLTNGPKTCAYRHGDDIHARQFVPRISRADVAHFMVDQLTDRMYIRCAPAVMP
jgi:putative NADH-flavin reductase